MPNSISRQELHQLVDSLPEDAVYFVRGVLEHYQVWPEPPPPAIANRRQEFMDRMRGHITPGTSGTVGGGGSYLMGPGGKIGSGTMSSSHWEAKSLVIETSRFHFGHELVIVERMHIPESGQQLIYSHEITGPDGTRRSHEITFELPAPPDKL